jgi:hypothetical protein
MVPGLEEMVVEHNRLVAAVAHDQLKTIECAHGYSLTSACQMVPNCCFHLGHRFFHLVQFAQAFGMVVPVAAT